MIYDLYSPILKQRFVKVLKHPMRIGVLNTAFCTQINLYQRSGLMSRLPVDLEQGEAFFRMRLDDDGIPCFTCGIYPEDETNEFNNNELLTLFMAGMISLLKTDVDNILSEGVKYLQKGNRPYDFIVNKTDQEYYDNLSDEQLELLSMDTKGEA